MAFTDGTITSLIKLGKEQDISHGRFHLKDAVMNNGVKHLINYDSIIDKYREILMQHTERITLTDLECEQYRYQPRKYCYDVYGSVEIWSTLLRMNNMLSPIDFDRRSFIGFNMSFFETLKEIMIMEADNIEKNRIDVEDK